MSETQIRHDPPPPEDPTHDVPVYPENDPPPGGETRDQGRGQDRAQGDEGGPPNPGIPSKGKDAGHDVEEDDLDPRRRIRRPTWPGESTI